MAYGKIKADAIIYDNSGSDVEKTIATLATPTPEGTVVKSTGESGTTKFLRVDGDGTCSWQVPPDTQLTTEAVQDLVGAMVTGNTETGITVTYEDSDGTLDFAVGTLNQDTTGTAAIATEITATANNSTNETVYPVFVDGATGTQGIETDTGLTYNPSTGLLTTAAVTTTGNVVVGGNLQVDGTTTTVNSSTMTVTDKNIEIAKGAANDAAADGAGITIDSGDGDKTWNWVDANDAWTSSEHIHVGDNKKFFAGTGKDLQLHHDGTNSVIGNTTGTLYYLADTQQFMDWAGGETQAKFVKDGAVELYHNAVKKIETTATGVDVTGTAVTDGLTVSGDSSFTGQSDFTGHLKEAVTVTAGKLSDNLNLDIENGNVFLFTTAESTTATPNLRYNASTALGTKMAIGDCLAVTIITTANASAYSAQLNIDGGAVTELWTGGSAPSGGGSSGKDIHAYTIIKVAATGTSQNDYTVIANHTKTS